MAVDLCDINDPCVIPAAAYGSEALFRSVLLNALRELVNSASVPEALLGRFALTTNDPATNQSILAAPGVGKAYRVRSLSIIAQDANTDVIFNSRSVGNVNTAISPTWDFLNNGGVVLPLNQDGWFQTLENEALVVTTTGGAADLIGTYEIIDV